MIIAACLASSLGLEPGRGSSPNAASNPPSRKRFRIFNTVGKVISRARHISWFEWPLASLGQDTCAGDHARTVDAFVDEGKEVLLLVIAEVDLFG